MQLGVFKSCAQTNTVLNKKNLHSKKRCVNFCPNFNTPFGVFYYTPFGVFANTP